MNVTLKSIAERVGKSITTVSRALAGYDDVSEATREEVRRVALELGYEPNVIARQLQKQRTDTLALILPTSDPHLTDPFFNDFLTGVSTTASQHGFDLLVSTRFPGDEEFEAYLKNIRRRRVDGFIVVHPRRQDTRISILQENRYPFVAFGQVEAGINVPVVDGDDQLGMRLIVDHLVGLGHTRLACITAPADLMLAHHRLNGFVTALEAHGLPADPALIIAGDLSQRSGREIGQALLARPNPPTAITACTDLMALGVMSAAQERGLVIGRQVSVTGFGDIALAEFSHPPLTTISQSLSRIGMLTCEMLVKIIKGEPLTEQQIMLKPSLVVRQSSGPKRR